MKVLANETKRILAVLLSVAMIFAYVPSTVSAYADEVSGNDTEEAAVEGSGEESISDALNYSVEGEENTSDEEIIDDPLNSKSDVELVLKLSGAYTEGTNDCIRYGYASSGDDPTIINLQETSPSDALGTTYMAKKFEGRAFLMPLIPAIFMTIVTVTYIIQAPEGLQFPPIFGNVAGLIFAAACFLQFKNTCQPNFKPRKV